MVRAYADYNASAPLRPEARAAIAEAMAWAGNPSSAHRDGARARRAIEEARAAVGALVGRPPREVVFTSGATEANALALTGLLRPGDRLVTSVVEHASVLETARSLERDGVEVTRLPALPTGEIDAAALGAALATPARLISLGWANGEVGAVLGSETLAIAAAAAAHLHLDAAQAVARIDSGGLPPRAMLSISAHKLGGPAGVGALVAPVETELRPLVRGGGQERGRRAGTENLLGIVGLGATAAALVESAEAERRRVRRLRDALWDRLLAGIPGIVRHGPPIGRALANTLNVTVPGLSGDALLMRLDLDGVSASLGSACAAGSPEASHVLLAMGRDEETARAGLRLSLGWATTEADVERIAVAVIAAARAAAGAAA